MRGLREDPCGSVALSIELLASFGGLSPFEYFHKFSKLEDHPLIFTSEAASLYDVEISLSAKKRHRMNTVKHSGGAVTIPSGA